MGKGSDNSNGEPSNLVQHIQFVEANLQRQIEWIKQHDQKSSVILGIVTAMTGFLANTWKNIESPSIDLTWAFGVALLLQGLVFVFLYRGGFPRTRGPDSLLFFGSIAKTNADAYVQQHVKRPLAEHAEDVASQCHVIAQIADIKYARLRWAYRFILLAIIPWTYVIAASHFGN